MSNDPIKEALGRLPYGFYAITSRNGEDVNVMVANWVTQASFTPRLMVLGLQKKSYTHGVISAGGVFAINIFNQEDQDAMTPFAKGRAKKPDKMAEAQYTAAPQTGCPVLAGAAAYVECKVLQMVDVGSDHDIVIGEVIGGDVLKEGDVDDTLTLSHLGWSYSG
jgi:flavin reductase (DIM6/NTAB) family NADH-FMN oxidoreductase RutF